MAKKTSEAKTPVTPPHQVFPIRKYLAADELTIESNKLNEIAQLVRLPASLSESDKNALIVRGLDLYESLMPSDGLEGMLAIQMVGTHHAALECLRRAAVPEQTLASRDMNLKHAAKLIALYNQQVAALDKHRGKGQQKVTVEHVYVAPGGQAIVGNVEAGSRALSSTRNAAPIAHQTEAPLDVSAKKVPNRRRKPKAE